MSSLSAEKQKNLESEQAKQVRSVGRASVWGGFCFVEIADEELVQPHSEHQHHSSEKVDIYVDF